MKIKKNGHTYEVTVTEDSEGNETFRSEVLKPPIFRWHTNPLVVQVGQAGILTGYLEDYDGEARTDTFWAGLAIDGDCENTVVLQTQNGVLLVPVESAVAATITAFVSQGPAIAPVATVRFE